VVFWSHLVLGVSASLVILLMSVTGVLLGYERQFIAMVDGAPRVTEIDAPRLPLDSLLSRAGIDRADVASVAMKARAEEPTVVRFRDRERAALTLNPYTAEAIQVRTDGKARAWMASLRRWHRWIGAEGGALRTRFKAVTGAANLAFLLIVVSGLWLWWPRNWNLKALRSVLWFRRGLSPKARDFNWHNTIGFWSLVPLFFVVASGVFISYRWPGLWLDRALGSPEERAAAVAAMTAQDVERSADSRAGGQGVGGGGSSAGGGAEERAARDSTTPTPAHASLNQYFLSASNQHPEWQSLTITLPAPTDSMATLAVAEGNTYRPDQRTTLVVDARTGDVREARDFGSLSTSRKIRAWVRFGHTGEVFGLAGQTLATLVTLGSVVLVWTGLALSWRRMLAWWHRSH
jgi:uncharacterized iron-regulated membrane protein